MNPSKHVTVIMHNVEYELMKTLIDFMYLGEVLVNQNNVDRFFKLAKTFNIQGFQNGFNKNEVSIYYIMYYVYLFQQIEDSILLSYYYLFIIFNLIVNNLINYYGRNLYW